MAAVKTREMKKKDGAKRAAGRLGKCLKAPFRLLSKAADFYVRSITNCSGRVKCGPSLVQLHGLPKSYSSSSSKSTILYTDEDLRELIRAASRRSLRDSGKIQLEIPPDQYGYYSSSSKIARSFTSGIGRIDEDKPCEFGEDVRVDGNINALYPRSRSHAVPRGGFILPKRDLRQRFT